LPLFTRKPDQRPYDEALAYLQQIGHDVIAAHRRSPGRGFAAMLLTAQREVGAPVLDDQRIVDEILQLLVATHECVASTIAIACGLLALDPAAQRRAQREVDAALSGRAPRYEDLPVLAHVTQVFQETQRLHPPAHLIARAPLEADRIDELTIPAGTPVVITPSVLHRLPSHGSDPDRFDPERFRPELVRARDPFTFIPSAAGPRIAGSFSSIAATAILTLLLQRHDLQLLPGQQIEIAPLVSMHLKGPLCFRLRPRARESRN
jgi:cytochrome P450